MKNLKKDYFKSFFSHIYVEKSIQNHPRTQKILEKFPHAAIIGIDHYKDVFCRSRQSHQLQHCAQKLILAARQGPLLYEGAPVCQSFGNQYFYYVSCAMNCIFDCEYCYLKGMYPSANIVVFVNLEDIFAEVGQMLENHPLYLCISYDTDLLALEQITGYAQEWCAFAAKHENLKIEIRTKCANRSFVQSVAPIPGVIYAFTLSPQAVIEAFEHRTPSLAERLSCAAELIRAGCPVRLCFDPMIYVPDWRQHYEAMLEQVCRMIDLEKIVDVSVGTFRISQDYLKNMRKQEPDSAVIWFPFQKEGSYCHYPNDLMEQMECFLTEQLEGKIPREKIFRWKI
ncbi:MAG: radical SAM protein [Lachnospiraceae bacterium]|nr:radical SAM protein [Lachnospiraceae bacterium]